MFAHLEIEDLLMKDYDVVFKTDIDVCYFENIENSIKSFFESNLPIAMAREHIHEIITRPLYKFYKQRKKAFNCGFLMLNSKKCKGKPTAIIAKTIKGKGISFMENQCSWHGAAPNEEQYNAAMAELVKSVIG